MNHLFRVFIYFSLILLAPLTYAEDSKTSKNGYITDNLSIFMHAGPGTNYKIVGSINAGSQIDITGNNTNDYAEIIDEKKRTAWVESKYISETAGLRSTVTELNDKVNKATDFTQQLDGEVNELKNIITNLEQQNNLLTKDAKKLNKALAETSSKLIGQDTDIQKQWFFNGAVVLGIGLILGLILPRIFTRRRGNMDSWS
jgi:SH3 domain protein